jgi:predicted alpha/beta hydrolase family esterase
MSRLHDAVIETDDVTLDWHGPVLVVPGLRGSGYAHWQTRWERRFPDFIRVQQADWNTPDLDRWARAVVEAALGVEEPALVIAHSFGCLAAVRAATFQSDLIAGALLVAPADPSKFKAEAVLSRPLYFPTTVVASADDPWIPLDAARRWAGLWGSEFVNVGHAGHINADSGFGDWTAGLGHLHGVCRRMNRVDSADPLRQRSQVLGFSVAL